MGEKALKHFLAQLSVFYIIILVVFCYFSVMLVSYSEANPMQKQRYIILLGASIGRAWDIESLPSRLKKNPLTPSDLRLTIFNYKFEYVGEYKFDKSKALHEILQRKEKRPDAIIIKECAAYFPGDVQMYQELMKGWIIKCKRSGIIPIPTTVVPVTRELPLKIKIKDIIKWIIGRKTQKSINDLRLKSLLEYNDWIKFFAQKECLVILDLETAVRISEEDRSLRPDLQSGDGLHLNEKAYTLLDQIVFPTLEKAFSRKY